MDLSSLALAPIAGVLSTLSPCVLPLLPVVLGTAAAEHRAGPFALAIGVALSFTVLGLFVSVVGFAIGIDSGLLRIVAAGIMIALGIVLMVPGLQGALAAAAGPLSNAIGQRFTGVGGQGIVGQFAIGLLLGAVWAPCVGPTLGAASVLAAQGESIGAAATTMALFGIGAALPLLIMGLLSREAMLRMRSRMLQAGGRGKVVLGGVLAVVGVLILTGADKMIEAQLVEMSPAWLTDLTTRF